MYLSPECFQNKPIDLLVSEGIKAEQLDDNCLGRALDRLFEAGITEVFTRVSSHALRVFGIQVKHVHLDSSSISLHGEYAMSELAADTAPSDDAPQPIRITHGYSRDHRPDLKQAMLGLICANTSNLPIWLSAWDGNQSDHKHFPKMIDAYVQQLSDEEELPIW